jgi:hypothetical protein
MRPLITLLSIALATHSSLAGPPTIRDLGRLPGINSIIATSISADGNWVAGIGQGWIDYGGDGSTPFRWSIQTGLQNLGPEVPPQPALSSFGLGISGDGSKVVGETAGQAFRWSEASGMTPLPFDSARGISDNGGTIVGSDAGRGAIWNGSLTVGGAVTSYNAVSANGNVAVGEGITYAMRYEGGMLQNLSLGEGHTRSAAYGVSANGHFVVGSFESPSTDGSEAVCWDATGPRPLGQLPGGYDSEALDVSEDGEVVVGVAKIAGTDLAFIWDSLNGMRDLKSALENDYGLDLTGWTLTRAVAISDDGRTIVGIGSGPGDFGGSWIVRIPEPNMGLALLPCAAWAMRRRR